MPLSMEGYVLLISQLDLSLQLLTLFICQDLP